MTLVVGLTGGIASGKTAAAEWFAELGADVVDTDVIAREVVMPGSEGLAEVVAAFGRDVVDAAGNLDRRAMRARIFSDSDGRRRLEAILHPLIEREVQRRVAASVAPYVVLVIPLLVEAGWNRLVDRIVVVDVPEATQRERLLMRDGAEGIEADAILASQAERGNRLAQADHVVDNTGTHADLRREVARLHELFRTGA